jgi:HSP20 family protein
MRRDSYYLVPLGRQYGLSRSPGQGADLASPWQMMRRIQEEMDSIFSQFIAGPGEIGGGPASSAGMQQWQPSVDVSESDQEWCIDVDLSGVHEKDVDVKTHDDHLIVRAELKPEEAAPQQSEPEARGERSGDGQSEPPGGQQQQSERQYHHRERQWGYFERVLPLPDNVNRESIHCEFKNGVLTLHLPKSEPKQPEGRRISIGVGEQPKATQRSDREPALAGSKGGETSSPKPHEKSEAGKRESHPVSQSKDTESREGHKAE